MLGENPENKMQEPIDDNIKLTKALEIVAAEPVKEPLIKVELNVGRKRTEEEISEFKKIREQSQEYVEKQKEISTREKEVKGKRDKGELLSSEELVFLRAREIKKEKVKSEIPPIQEIKPDDKKTLEGLGASSSVEKPVTTPEKDIETVLKYRGELVESFGNLVDSKPWLFINDDPKHSEHRATIEENYSRMQRAAFKLTGENFDTKVRVEARAEVDKRNAEIEKENKDRANEKGYKKQEKTKVSTKKELFSPENRSKLELAEAQRIVGAGIRASWENLADKKKEKFPKGPKEYARHLEAERIRLSKKRIDIPKDTYFYLLSLGFEPQKAKKGFLSKKVFIPCRPGAFIDGEGNKVEGLLSLTPDKIEDFHAEFVSKIKNNVGENLKDTYDKGREMWMSRKVVAMREIINDVVSDEKPVDIRAINKGERNTEAFEKTIETAKTENALDRLSDEELAAKSEKLNKTLWERMDRVKKIISEDCEPICRAFGFSPEKSETFIKAAKNEENMPDLDERSGSFLTNILENLKRIRKEYQDAVAPIDKIEDQRAKTKIKLAKIEADQKIEKALTEIREKLAAA